jgi:hypothetical protein
VIEAIERGDLVAPALLVARIEGAVNALEAITSGQSVASRNA